MPDCADPARQRTVLFLAYNSSIRALQPILEEAVHAGNVELIENTTKMLEKALKSSSTENDAATVYKSGGKITQLPSIESQYSRHGGPCKPEDCKDCFYNVICQMEEASALANRVKKLVDEVKLASIEAVARKNRGYKVAF